MVTVVRLCANYVFSLRDFVKDAGDYAVRMVDNLLDILTGHEHSKASRIIAEVSKINVATRDTTTVDIRVCHHAGVRYPSVRL